MRAHYANGNNPERNSRYNKRKREHEVERVGIRSTNGEAGLG